MATLAEDAEPDATGGTAVGAHCSRPATACSARGDLVPGSKSMREVPLLIAAVPQDRSTLHLRRHSVRQKCVEVTYRFQKTLFERNGRLPTEPFLCFADVRLT